MSVKIRLIGFMGVVIMSGWGGLGGYVQDLGERRQAAGDPGDTSPFANLTRRACDWVARKGLGPSAAPQAHYACGPYWYDAPYDPPGDLPQPVQGGQCEGVAYDCFITRVRPNQTEPTTSEAYAATNFVGPCNVTGITEGGPSGADPDASIWTFTVVNGDTSFPGNVAAIGPPSFEFVRVDGLPDECGNPDGQENPRDPVDLPPGTLPPDGQPVDISDPNDPNDTTPPVIFAPNPPPEYEPFVPFVPQFPGAPPFAFPPSPGDDIPPRVGDPVDVPPGGTGSDDVDTPDDGLPDECIGYSWEFYDIPANRGGIPGANPKRFYEIFGSAQLRVSSRDAGLYDTPVKIDSERGVCYRSDKNLRVRGLSLNSKTTFGPVRVRPVYVVVRES